VVVLLSHAGTPASRTPLVVVMVEEEATAAAARASCRAFALAAASAFVLRVCCLASSAAGLRPFASAPRTLSSSAWTWETSAWRAADFEAFLSFFLVLSVGESLVLSLKMEVIPARELRRTTSLLMEPSFLIMTLALLTVEEREMLSVLALSRELKREAARLFFFVWAVTVDSPSLRTPLGVSGRSTVEGALPLEWKVEALMDSSSSGMPSSLRAVKEKARRMRPLKPLRPEPVAALEEDSSMVGRSLSSRDMRFSEAVKVPWERGEGRGRRWVDGEAVGEDEDAEGWGRGGGGEEEEDWEGRGEEADEEEEPLRLWGVRVEEEDGREADADDDDGCGGGCGGGGFGDVRGRDGTLWPLWALWLLLVRGRLLEDELRDEDEAEASGRA
jgi:hypothetical protein